MRIAKQLFNIVMEKCLSFCRSLCLIASEWVVRIKVMKVSIHIAIATCCIAISYPSFAESKLVIPRNAGTEVSNCGLQNGEFCFQFIGKTRTVPSSEGWVEVAKLSQNDVTKLHRSSSVSNVSLDSKKSKNSDKCNNDCFQNFQALIPLWIISLYFMFQPLFGLTFKLTCDLGRQG
jgi:hypothetical protein